MKNNKLNTNIIWGIVFTLILYFILDSDFWSSDWNNKIDILLFYFISILVLTLLLLGVRGTSSGNIRPFKSEPNFAFDGYFATALVFMVLGIITVLVVGYYVIH
ncbi:MAG: hypothetical protein WCJ59_01260 [bacterium]